MKDDIPTKCEIDASNLSEPSSEMLMEKELHNRRSKYKRIFLAVSAYWVVSMSMVFLNKHLLSSPKSLNIPLAVTWFQCVVTVALSTAGLAFNERKTMHFPTVGKMLKMLPLSIAFVGMITLNNLTLKNLTVSFYMVGRSLTTVFNVVLSKLVLNSTTSIRCIIACAIIIAGFIVGIDQESEFGALTVAGVACGVGSSFCVALNAIFLKKYLPVAEDSAFLLTYYNNINACFMFLPLMATFGEVNRFGAAFNNMNSPVYSLHFWASMVLSGVLGFSISYVSTKQVEVTSPLTHNISGTAKAYVQTLLAVLIWKERRSFLWWLSNVAVLSGSAYYTHVRHCEMRKDIRSQSV